MKSLALENVKAFKDSGDIELAPITILVGQNSCGKSSFIRFPAVLAQTVENNAYPLCLHSPSNEYVDYGSFHEALHNHTGNSFGFKCSFSHDELLNVDPREHYPQLLCSIWKNAEIKDVSLKIIFAMNKDNLIYITECSVYYDNEKAFSCIISDGLFSGRIMVYKGINVDKIINTRYSVTTSFLPNHFTLESQPLKSVMGIMDRTIPLDEKQR